MIYMSLLAGVLAICVATAPVALAQTGSSSTGKPAAGTYEPRTTTDVPEDRDPAPSMLQNLETEHLSAQELRNKPVYDGKNERIATVSEVTGTPGQNRQAILATGGVLGVGGHEVALPIDKLSIAPDGRLVLNMTADDLKLLPKYR